MSHIHSVQIWKCHLAFCREDAGPAVDGEGGKDSIHPKILGEMRFPSLSRQLELWVEEGWTEPQTADSGEAPHHHSDVVNGAGRQCTPPGG